MIRLLLLLAIVAGLPGWGAPAVEVVSFELDDGQVVIRIGATRVATYVYEDEAIPRPYFANLQAPGGVPVTRTHPPDPVADRGNDDHGSFHPGVWLAFGDINGEDSWRLRARIRHVGFSRLPSVSDGVGDFEVINAYESLEGERVCEERCRYTFRKTGHGFLMTSRSTFRALDHDVVFGDQEEMGFGVRLATPLTVRHGSGTLRNSAGGVNEAGTWGKQARWCAGYGTVGDVCVGMLVMPAPDNFRMSWFHSRDYGLIVANTFGRKAMTGPNDDSVLPEATRIPKGEQLELAHGLYLFRTEGEAPPDMASLYRDYCQVVAEGR